MRFFQHEKELRSIIGTKMMCDTVEAETQCSKDHDIRLNERQIRNQNGFLHLINSVVHKPTSVGSEEAIS
jgi:hypothetical protein